MERPGLTPPGAASGAPGALRDARGAVARGDRAALVGALDRLIAAAPTSVGLLLTIAGLDAAAGTGTRAEAALARAEALCAGDEQRRAVLDARVGVAESLGWLPAAAAPMEAALALAADGRPARLQALGDLYFRAGCPELAVAPLRALIEAAPSSLRAHLALGEALEEAGRFEEAVAAFEAGARAAAGPPEEAPWRVRIASRLMRLGAFESAAGHLRGALGGAAPGPDADALLGTMALWRGDLETARACAGRLDAADPEACRLRGAVLLLGGDPAGALASLDAALARSGGDAEAHVWRAEALLRLGRPEEALAAANRGGECSPEFTQYFAAQAVKYLAMSRLGTLRRLPAGPFVDALQALHPPEQAEAILHAQSRVVPPGEEHRADRDRVEALLEQALAMMRGNRSFAGTYAPPDDPGGPPRRFHLPSPRAEARDALRYLGVEGPEAAARRLDAVAARHPRRCEPRLYQGELELFLGRWAEARARFDAALRLEPHARWGFIGLGAAALGAGDPRRCLEVLARGVAMSGGAGPTLFVYRGEAHRRLGQWGPARADLEEAVRRNPTRVSAWINLALLHGAEGDPGGQDAIFDRVMVAAPGLLADAALALGTDVPLRGDRPPEAARALLEQALVMMRGNRSSNAVTYFLADGRMRAILPQHRRDRDGVDRELLPRITGALDRALQETTRGSIIAAK